MTMFCSEMLRSLGQQDKTISMVFVSAAGMRSLNSRYRDKDYATDVLSFSYGAVEVEGAVFLGEIFIAPEVAARQATRYGTSPDRELKKLVLHGTLHLMGYDHEKDRGEMNRLQGRLMRRKLFTASLPFIKAKADR